MEVTYKYLRDAKIVTALLKHNQQSVANQYPNIFKPYNFDDIFVLNDNALSNPIYHSIVAFSNNQPIGFILFGEAVYPEPLFKANLKYINIDSITVLPEFCRMGIGTGLLNKLKSFAYEKSYKEISSEIFEYQESNVNFFFKNGFKDHIFQMSLDFLSYDPNIINSIPELTFQVSKDSIIALQLFKINYQIMEKNYPAHFAEYNENILHDMIDRLLKRDNFVCINVCCNSEIIGNAIIYEVNASGGSTFQDDYQYISIYDFMIVPEHQNRGYGTMLMERIKMFALEKGFKIINLHVWDYNINAIRLYTKTGFEKYKKIVDLCI
ncbi:MAG: hypothetical protein A2015_06035 [Spirochaetes bacterium GWF1_31_7]|nr:MAG: hypothetical protein A2Y30_07675 [Spirochaetes bacterium GWE1_32_154]OHD50816.1 MAG: hypothetical protein A2Y29_02665 [Spirochaetes bacterium GWE2_31_10]OHD52753.1 MAG: hypothetical protein A2015_06035 [Spirochaetes bacterium GWF1_31_7]OHD82198.1 MAG: hypothetical protein A2355_18400 [Spirochaetes bacterium RIFOXYB1_FULL_32_8]